MTDSAATHRPPTPPPSDPPAPDWKDSIPEKFHADTLEASVAKMGEAYKNLETKLGQPAEPKQGLDIKESAPADADINWVLGKANLTSEDIASQFQEHGKLTDDQYAKLAEQGYPSKVVDLFLKSEQASAANQVSQATAAAEQAAGGAEQVQNLLAWAGQNITPEQRETFNAQLKDPSTSGGAIFQLMAMKAQADGSANSQQLINPTTGTPGTNTGAITDLEEFLKINREAANARANGAPRADLEARLRASDINRTGVGL